MVVMELAVAIVRHSVNAVCCAIFDVMRRDGGGDVVGARGVYERALAELADSEKTEKLFSAFAHFEERCKEFDRAR